MIKFGQPMWLLMEVKGRTYMHSLEWLMESPNKQNTMAGLDMAHPYVAERRWARLSLMPLQLY